MEHIWHITAPLDEQAQASLQKTMLARGGSLHKANRVPADNWWVIFLPDGTLQEKQEPDVGIPKYKIILPDGYAFYFEAGTKNKHGVFTRAPAIFLDGLEGEGER